MAKARELRRSLDRNLRILREIERLCAEITTTPTLPRPLTGAHRIFITDQNATKMTRRGSRGESTFGLTTIPTCQPLTKEFRKHARTVRQAWFYFSIFPPRGVHGMTDPLLGGEVYLLSHTRGVKEYSTQS